MRLRIPTPPPARPPGGSRAAGSPLPSARPALPASGQTLRGAPAGLGPHGAGRTRGDGGVRPGRPAHCGWEGAGAPGPSGLRLLGLRGAGGLASEPPCKPCGAGGRVRGGGAGGGREALPGICRGAAPTAGREGGGERAAGEPGEGPQDGARPPPAPCPGKTPLGCPWAPPLLRQRSAGGPPLTRSCKGRDEPAGGGGRSGDRRARARRGAGSQGPASSRLSPRPPGETWGPPKASWVASCWETWLPALPVHGGPGSRVAFPRAGPRRPEVKRARRRCVPQAHARRGFPGPSAPERVKPTAGRDLPSRTPSRPRGRLSQLPARSCPLQAAPPPRRRAPARAPRPAESR